MKYLHVLICVVILSSCRGKDNLAEVRDGEFLIQASFEGGSTDSLQQYKVRVFPDIKRDEVIDKKIRQQMTYQIDSCFYLVRDGIAVYPEGITPVANGLRNCFEYLVIFAGDQGQGDVLHYLDKYLSKNNYQLNFK